jgi:hypothetical protein
MQQLLSTTAGQHSADMPAAARPATRCWNNAAEPCQRSLTCSCHHLPAAAYASSYAAAAFAAALQATQVAMLCGQVRKQQHQQRQWM